MIVSRASNASSSSPRIHGSSLGSLTSTARPFLRFFVVLLAEPSLLWTHFNSMLAPRRPNIPVLVLEHQRIPTSNLAAKEEPHEQGREGPVGGVELHKVKWNNGTASSTGRCQQGPAPYATPSASQVTLSRTTYTISVLSIPSATSIAEGGAKIETEALPAQNQNKPNIDDSKLGTQVLPGVNQDTSNMGELPESVSSSIAASPERSSAAPAITVNKPLPGQNQANPIMGELAPPPVISPALSFASIPSSTLSSSYAPLTSSVERAAAATVFSSSTAPTQTSSATSSSLFTTFPVASFITITRSEQNKEQSPVTIALPSTISMSATSTVTSAINDTTPQAIAVAQSFSKILSTTTAIVAATLSPTAPSSNEQDGSILHPTARTLLILFVILGGISVLVAIIILMMIRSHKKRSRTQQQSMMGRNPYDASRDRVGVTTHILANPNDNPFLTASEKAIIDRAASPDGASDTVHSASISDAISSFIKKSRRLTYKISP